MGPFTPLVIVVVIVFVLIGVLAVLKQHFGGALEQEEDLPYERKPFVFDAISELTLYRLLTEIFGDRYYIFPQISYGRLIQIKRGVKTNRNRFDKKIADFVLCDRERAVAQLVIELDGYSHQSEKKIERDELVDKMMEKIGLPILHLKTTNMDREYLKQEVSKKLGSSN